MSECGHNHEEIDKTLLKRLRFIKLSLDTLLLDDNPNRVQACKAANVMLQIIGVTNGNQPADNTMNSWVYAKELVTAMSSNVSEPITTEEVTQFFLRVEALSEQALDGREESFAKEQARLTEMNVEKPVAGLIRIVMLIDRMIKKRHNFKTVDVDPAEVFTSAHLIRQDLNNWKSMGMKPHWFNDNFLIFRDTIDERMKLDEDERASLSATEEGLIFKLFMIRHSSPEGITLKKYYAMKIQESLRNRESENNGERADEKITDP
jgi:hypothetical protein